MAAATMENNGEEQHDPPPEYQLYMDMPEWKDIPAPPTYEDAVILGMNDPAYPPGYDSSQIHNTVTSLGYVDFLPRRTTEAIGDRAPEYEEFKVVMTMANNWLLSYPNYRVIRCESIERCVDQNGIVETESTVQHTSAWGVTSLVRGLRLWLTTKHDSGPVQKIWYMNVMPKPIAATLYYGRAMRFGYNYAMTMNKKTIYPDFEDLDPTVEQLNKKLKENPIPGSVLNVESIDMKYGNNMWDRHHYNPNDKPYNPDKGYWGEMKGDGVLYLTVLRIFFVHGTPEPVEIGFEDFVPYCLKNLSGGKPVFEKTSDVVPRVSAWMNANKNCRITNMDTIQTKVSKDFFRSGTDGVRTNSKRTYFSIAGETTYVNVIRVAYIKPGKNNLNGVSVKSFVPIRYPGGGKNSECLSDVMARINTWLAITGADVINADTLKFDFVTGTSIPIDSDRTATHIIPHKGYYWMTVIQLYIHGSYTEPPPEVLPPAPAVVSSSCCSIM